jgi:hypothetical protein
MSTFIYFTHSMRAIHLPNVGLRKGTNFLRCHNEQVRKARESNLINQADTSTS